ncbi:MAG: hypothetical protein M3291_02300, partial [Actinomycetota bacterium]|nr:hypothetical protein [Actinomycetota bacterium]
VSSGGRAHLHVATLDGLVRNELLRLAVQVAGVDGNKADPVGRIRATLAVVLDGEEGRRR